jgi:hypothetical protein
MNSVLSWTLAILAVAIVGLTIFVAYRYSKRSREAELADATAAHELGSETLLEHGRDHQKGYGYPHQ